MGGYQNNRWQQQSPLGAQQEITMAIDELRNHQDDPEDEEEEEEAPPEEEEAEEEEEEDEEELVDPIEGLQESCGESNACAPSKEKYSTCNDRVNGRSKTEETCDEELIDYLHCVDHCLAASNSLFSK